LLATLALSEFLDELDPRRDWSLWYNARGPYGNLFLQVNAVAYLNDSGRRINNRFPALDSFGGPLGSEGRPPSPNDRILVLAADADSPARAEAALKSSGLAIRDSRVFQFRLGGETGIFVTQISTQSE
jgi:hypothetical protein